MPKDTFFTQQTCDRCHGSIPVRTMSWFTNETICMTCCDKEQEIKQQLRSQGIQNAMEGCGYVPDPSDPSEQQAKQATDEANGPELPENFTLRSHQ